METFNRNPGRAQAYTVEGKSWIVCKNDGTTFVPTADNFKGVGIYTPLFQLSAFSSGYILESNTQPNLEDYPNKVGGENMLINDQTLEAIDATFKAAQEAGVVCIPRFAYDEEGIVGREPDDIQWVLKHIKQISKILNKYKGTVISIECGIIGAFGEMWGSKYENKDDMNTIIGAWLDHLDESIMVQVRSPKYMIQYLASNWNQVKEMMPFEEGSDAYRLGFYNDGYMGTSADWGTFLGDNGHDFTNLTRKTAVAFMKDQNKHIPYGGEFAYPDNMDFVEKNGSLLYSYEMVKELYDSHLCYLRNLTSSSLISEFIKTLF